MDEEYPTDPQQHPAIMFVATIKAAIRERFSQGAVDRIWLWLYHLQRDVEQTRNRFTTLKGTLGAIEALQTEALYKHDRTVKNKLISEELYEKRKTELLLAHKTITEMLKNADHTLASHIAHLERVITPYGPGDRLNRARAHYSALYAVVEDVQHARNKAAEEMKKAEEMEKLPIEEPDPRILLLFEERVKKASDEQENYQARKALDQYIKSFAETSERSRSLRLAAYAKALEPFVAHKKAITTGLDATIKELNTALEALEGIIAGLREYSKLESPEARNEWATHFKRNMHLLNSTVLFTNELS